MSPTLLSGRHFLEPRRDRLRSTRALERHGGFAEIRGPLVHRRLALSRDRDVALGPLELLERGLRPLLP
jgi:hypothetical protein